jgi:hypothetical protein
MSEPVFDHLGAWITGQDRSWKKAHVTSLLARPAARIICEAARGNGLPPTCSPL